MFYVRIGIDFTDGNQRERFLGVAVECTRFFAQYVVPSSVINVRVACNGFTSAHNIEVALSFTYKFLAAFDVDAV